MPEPEDTSSDGEADLKLEGMPLEILPLQGSPYAEAGQLVLNEQASAVGPLDEGSPSQKPWKEIESPENCFRASNSESSAGKEVFGKTQTGTESWNPAVRMWASWKLGPSPSSRLESEKGRLTSRQSSIGEKSESSAGEICDDVRLRQQIETELTKDLRFPRRSSRISASSQNSSRRSNSSLNLRSEDSVTVAAISSPLMLRICGVLPWGRYIAAPADTGGLLYCGSLKLGLGSRTWYQLLVLTSVLAAFGFAIYQAAAPVPDELTVGMDELAETESAAPSSLRHKLLADIPLAAGALIGLWQIVAVQRAQILGGSSALLVRYALHKGTHDIWANISMRDMRRLLVIWCGMLLDRALMAREGFNLQFLLNFVTFAVMTSVLIALLYCISHISRALATMVDAFCHETVVAIQHQQNATKPNPAERNAIMAWNVFQATVRKACCAIDRCFTVLFASAMTAVLLPLLMSSSSWDASIPGVLFSLAVAVVASIAGEVTSKCDRVPAIINTLSFGEDELSIERQYIVTHMVHSLAGFYLLDVRLTMEMVFKTAYFSSAIGAFLITQLHT
jgi:hypothetical protein